MNLFSEKEVSKAVIENASPECDRCGLLHKVNSPMMDVGGKGKRNALILAEAPGPTEDSQNDQLVGQTGTKLHDDLHYQTRLDIHNDFWKLNAINCWPHDEYGGTVTPTSVQIKACKPYVMSKIEEYNPKYIILCGGTAIQSFLGNRFSDLSISRWRGLCIPDKKAWVIPIYHPSYVSRQGDPNLDAVWNKDLKNIGFYLNKKPYRHLKENIEILYNIDDILLVLDKLVGQDIYFDYETTGLKPYRPGHQIATIAVNHYSFPFMYRDFFTSDEIYKIGKAWIKVLKSPGKKGAHNLKFEDAWSRTILKTKPVNWNWCSMNAAHVIDNRRRFTGLKFQTYINFGVDPYDKDIKQYLQGKGGGNDFNNIHEAPLDKLLLYGGRDVFYGQKLMEKQKLKLVGRLGEAYKEQIHEGLLAMSDIQQTGICVSEKYYHDEGEAFADELKNLNRDLFNSAPAKKFKKIEGRDFNPRSNPDLSHLFYDILKMKPPKLTQAGNPSVDKESLDNLFKDVSAKDQLFTKPFIANLLEIKKIEKIANTYLSQYRRELYNSKIHPFFDLHIPITFRSSSSLVNFQNVPKHDEVAKKACRSGIFPSPGNQLMEADYSGIEVMTSACYHKDPNMIKYVSDKAHDMHRDSACEIWKIDPAQVTKDIRYVAKNCWVFPQFYGSWYGECGKNLWAGCKESPTTDGLNVHDNFNSYDDFLGHLEKAESLFWDVRFPVYKRWKFNMNKFFQEYGYIDTYFGFKLRGYMKDRDVSNYPIQLTAFHCLLWSLIRINKVAKKENWKTKIIGQIHDSIMFDLYPPERKHVIETIMDIGTKKIRERFDWIIVPLEIELEIAPVDGSWYELEEYEEAA